MEGMRRKGEENGEENGKMFFENLRQIVSLFLFNRLICA